MLSRMLLLLLLWLLSVELNGVVISCCCRGVRRASTLRTSFPRASVASLPPCHTSAPLSFLILIFPVSVVFVPPTAARRQLTSAWDSNCIISAAWRSVARLMSLETIIIAELLAIE